MAPRRNCARLAVSQKPSSSQARLRPTKQGLLTVGWRKFEFQTRAPAGAAFRKHGPLVNAPFTAFILRTRAKRANSEGSVKAFPGTNAFPHRRTRCGMCRATRRGGREHGAFAPQQKAMGAALGR